MLLTVKVTDENDHQPVLTNNPGTLDVPDNAGPGDFVKVRLSLDIFLSSPHCSSLDIAGPRERHEGGDLEAPGRLYSGPDMGNSLSLREFVMSRTEMDMKIRSLLPVLLRVTESLVLVMSLL